MLRQKRGAAFPRRGVPPWLASDNKQFQEDNKERIMATMEERSARKRERQEKLVEAIKANPDLTYSDVARILGVPKSTIVNDVNELARDGRIERRGKTEYDISTRRRAVLNLLLDDPTRSNSEIARRLNITEAVAKKDRFFLEYSGLVRRGRRRGRTSTITSELLKQVAKLDDFDCSVQTTARKIGVPYSRLIKAREVLRCKFTIENEETEDRDFRERQKKNINLTARLRRKGYACFGFMGVNLPREEHKRWLALHNLRKMGLQWTPDGVVKVHGEKRRKVEAFASGWKIGEQMRKRGIKTELQAKRYGFNER